MRLTTTNEELTEQCNHIFGDIVVEAYFVSEHYSESTPPYTTLKDTVLEWGSDTFVVKFMNGSVVKFNNSEWAYLERLDDVTASTRSKEK